jgi:hypothetical protein
MALAAPGTVARGQNDLPLRAGVPGHNAKKLMGLRKAIERIRKTDPYLKYDHFELTNEGAARMAADLKSGHAPNTERRPFPDSTRSPPGLNCEIAGACDLRTRRAARESASRTKQALSEI